MNHARGSEFLDTLAPIGLLDSVGQAALSRLSKEMRRFYQPGDALALQGEPADHLFIIERGQLKIVADSQVLATRGPGEIVGEQSFIERVPRGATITAITQVQALRIPEADVQQLLQDGVFVRNLLRAMSCKLSESTRDRAIRYRQEGLLLSEFSAHVSPEMAQRLLGTGLNYGQPHIMDGVVLFADIRNFTALSCSMEPLAIAAELTSYINRMVDVIHAHDGYVDKFIGDAVMAVWGLEAHSREEMARLAFQCAKQMVQEASRLMFGGSTLQIGVGLHAGPMFSGNVGGDGKRQFTVLGPTVNLAARIESQAKLLDAPLVLSDTIAAQLRSEDLDSLVVHDDVAIKGANSQTLYTLTFAVDGGRR